MKKKSIQETIDSLRALSQPRPPEQVRRLREIETQTKMIGEIFGIFGGTDEKLREDELKAQKYMSFEEKRKLYQAEFPNKVSAEKRAKAREALNYIAQNPHLFMANRSVSSGNKYSSLISSIKPITSSDTSRSWPPSDCTDADSLDLRSIIRKKFAENLLSKSPSKRSSSGSQLSTDKESDEKSIDLATSSDSSSIGSSTHFFSDDPFSTRRGNPVVAHIITTRSWPSSEEDSGSEMNLTAPRVGKKSMGSRMSSIKSVNTSSVSSSEKGISSEKSTTLSSKSGKSSRPYELNSRFNGTFRFGNYDNFANFSESADDSSDSIITVYDECSTPVYYEESTATPLLTCVE